MIRKILKWVGIVLGSLVGLLGLAVVAVYLMTSARINKVYDVPVVDIPIPTGAEAIAYGEHVATIRACNGCHGPDLGGRPLIENPAIGYFYPPNLTTGQGGRIRLYSHAHIARAIRHGVGYDNKPLLAMPSHQFDVLSD